MLFCIPFCLQETIILRIPQSITENHMHSIFFSANSHINRNFYLSYQVNHVLVKKMIPFRRIRSYCSARSAHLLRRPCENIVPVGIQPIAKRFSMAGCRNSSAGETVTADQESHLPIGFFFTYTPPPSPMAHVF